MKAINVTPYCFLLGDATQWEVDNLDTLVLLFRSVIEEFNGIVGVNPQKLLHIQPDYGLGHPRITFNGVSYVIHISARKSLWSKYVYEFAHEYCHYLIGSEFGKRETTYWFEESICTTASLLFLRRTALRWKDYDPNSSANVLSPSERNALEELKRKAQDNEAMLQIHLKDTPPIEGKLPDWIRENMPILSEEVDHREMYSQIAAALYGLFLEYPDLWKIIPFLKRPSKEEYINFETFVQETLKDRINVEIEHFRLFVECLTGQVMSDMSHGAPC